MTTLSKTRREKLIEDIWEDIFDDIHGHQDLIEDIVAGNLETWTDEALLSWNNQDEEEE